MSESTSPSSRLPFFSVVIATRNRPTVLAECLESFTRLNYPDGLWEIIVVNDGGEYSLENLSDEIQETLPLIVLNIDHAGPAAARNAGVRSARGEFVAITDDDCVVDSEWLRALDAGFHEGWDALGGEVQNFTPQKTGAEAWHNLLDFLNIHLLDHEGNALLLVSSNVAYRKFVFEALGGFDEDFPWAGGEDRDLSFRLLSAGYTQSHWPQAVVWHHQANLTVGKHLRQQFRYGRGSWYFHRTVRKLDTPPGLKPRPSSDIMYARTLLAHLNQRRVPLIVSLVIFGGQVMHRLGRFYQGLLERIKG